MTASSQNPFHFKVVHELPGGEATLRDCLLTENLPWELRVTNVLLRDDQALLLTRLTEASPEKFHFRLEFKTGLLATAPTTSPDTGWKVHRVEESERGTTQVFLSWTQTAKRVEAGETLTIPIQGLFASSGGNQPTIPMLVSWSYVTPATASDGANQSDLEALEEETEQTTFLVLEKKSWPGRTHIPLRLDVVGSHYVLNEKSHSNELVIRVTNPPPSSGQDQDVIFKYSANVAERAFLNLMVAAGDIAPRPFALGTQAQLNQVTATFQGFSLDSRGMSPDAIRYFIKFTPTADLTLKPGEFKELVLSNLVTEHPSGPVTVELEYGRVPGFRDGKLTCLIEKAPLVFGRDTNSGNVGIGEGAPRAKLSVKGGPLRLEGAELQSKESLTFRANTDKQGEDFAAKFFAKDGQQPLMELDASGQLSLRTGSGKHGFQHTDGTVTVSSFVKSASSPVGGWWGTMGDHSLHFLAGNLTPKMTLMSTGHLGIGTQSPKAPLNVHGNVLIQNNGKLGIGTTTPGAPLDVHGEFFVKGKKAVEILHLSVADHSGSTVTLSTTYKASEWYLAICGITAGYMQASWGFTEYQALANPGENWRIVISAGGHIKSLTCHVLCIPRELCKGFLD
ncbi:hypothetical protein [Vitiosangium sp. GDMCC 1.1324]|uniref:hypothetical protein n=1 Tax=Vitiosangium sp. (strain GDMCC 1.1324) TaxID=2138576 RepID=UPI0011B6C99F|nr:hypothetical protein [Vitiosangium sp. GDMCC 1.1324]